MYNKMTGRPLQLDFGKSRVMLQVKTKSQHSLTPLKQGFVAAGLGDVAQKSIALLSMTYLAGG